VNLRCPHCGCTIIAEESDRGKPVKCLGCGEEVIVPGEELPPIELDDTSEGSEPFDIDLDELSPASTAAELESLLGGGPAPEKPSAKIEMQLPAALVTHTNPLSVASSLMGVAGLLAVLGWVALAILGEPLAVAKRQLLQMGFIAGVSVAGWIAAVALGIAAQAEISLSNGTQKGKLPAFLGALLGIGSLVVAARLAYNVFVASGSF
jgi:hypothetical protein